MEGFKFEGAYNQNKKNALEQTSSAGQNCAGFYFKL